MKGLLSVPGIKVAGAHCGIKKRKKDISLIYSEAPANWAGVFTTNKIKSHCIAFNKKRRHNKIQAILINSGNANVGTGEKGRRDVEKMAKKLSFLLNIPYGSILIAQTGKIGKFLPMEKIEKGIEMVVRGLDKGTSKDCSEGIMTTDKHIKEEEIDLGFCSIAGIAKGAGMIFPHMATMLAFIVTDAMLDNETLKEMLKDCVDETFNRISVDGETSTNDMVILLANGLSKNIDRDRFKDGLFSICSSLARKIVEDGEGATKLIRVVVEGARNKREAKHVAETIANSSLVKTAMYGEDPNFGRILAAIGNSKALFNLKHMNIWLQGHLTFTQNSPVECDYQRLKGDLSEKEIEIRVSLGVGNASVSFLTCDLTPSYVKINAMYS